MTNVHQHQRTNVSRTLFAWMSIIGMTVALCGSGLAPTTGAAAQKAGEYTPESDRGSVMVTEAGDHAPPDPDAPQSSVRVIEDGDIGRTGIADGPSNNWLEIRAQGCPPGYDASAATHSQLIRDCTVNPGSVEFTISSGNLGDLAQWTTDDEPNIATFTDLPTDDNPFSLTYTRGLRFVVESTRAPESTRRHVVTCSYWDEPNGEVDYGPLVMEMVDKTSIMVAVDNRDTVSCDWFFIPEASAVVVVPGLDPDVEPAFLVTPVVQFPVPTATPEMPQVDITLPIENPIPVVTPIIIEPQGLAPHPGDRD